MLPCLSKKGEKEAQRVAGSEEILEPGSRSARSQVLPGMGPWITTQATAL